jgi:hypothetical protein
MSQTQDARILEMLGANVVVQPTESPFKLKLPKRLQVTSERAKVTDAEKTDVDTKSAENTPEQKKLADSGSNEKTKDNQQLSTTKSQDKPLEDYADCYIAKCNHVIVACGGPGKTKNLMVKTKLNLMMEDIECR